MKDLKRMIASAAENLETFSHPRVSVALQNFDLVYVRVYNPSPDLGMDIIGKRLEDIVGDTPEAKRLTAIKRKVIRSGTPHHETTTLPLGRKLHTFDLNIEPTYDESGQIDGLMSANIDVTDLVQARKQLAAANARLVKLLGTAFDGEPSRQRTPAID
jgi:PAS domain-containing protein